MHVAVNMAVNVKYESLSISIGVEMTDIDFYAFPLQDTFSTVNPPQHKQTRPQWLTPFSAIAARDNLVPVAACDGVRVTNGLTLHALAPSSQVTHSLIATSRPAARDLFLLPTPTLQLLSSLHVTFRSCRLSPAIWRCKSTSRIRARACRPSLAPSHRERYLGGPGWGCAVC